MNSHPLHEKAMLIVKSYLSQEAELISLLQKIQNENVHLNLGYASMAQYAISGLGLPENQAYMLIGVARKCSEVPQLKMAIETGELSANTAKKMLSAIRPDNANEWIEKAKALPQKALEREVARANPDKTLREFMKPLSESITEFKAGLSDEEVALLTRCREIVAQKASKNVSWAETLQYLAKSYLKHEDPILKAERAKPKLQVARPVKQLVRQIPASLKHQVNLRDHGQCRFRTPNGKRCDAKRWLEVHHIRPLSYGGKHELENLVTLCSAHHTTSHGRQNQKGLS